MPAIGDPVTCPKCKAEIGQLVEDERYPGLFLLRTGSVAWSFGQEGFCVHCGAVIRWTISLQLIRRLTRQEFAGEVETE